MTPKLRVKLHHSVCLSKTAGDDKSTRLRRQIIQQFHGTLKQAENDVAVKTGIERRERRMALAPGGGRGELAPLAAGNSANAVLSAEVVSRKV